MRKLAMIPALLVTIMSTPFGCAPRNSVTHQVAIKGFEYAPAKLAVQSGDTISWTNHDIVPHTATGSAPGLNSGSMDSGKAWRYVATTKGTHSYKCAFHPTMVGSVEVR